jgi:oligopeptide/dipeptide ABC transporter ATP-binding protein
MLALVRIPSPERRLSNYPHQLSGGMRQRVVGAMALACQPHLLIADEPTTSLDVTLQVQYLNLLKEIQKKQKVALLFITHDFGIVAKMSDRVAVMYAGKIVEMATVRDIFNQPAHPYTLALMNSVPKLESKKDRLFSIEGQPPNLYDPPPGCKFSTRCHQEDQRCIPESPPEVDLGHSHKVWCWHYV